MARLVMLTPSLLLLILTPNAVIKIISFDSIDLIRYAYTSSLLNTILLFYNLTSTTIQKAIATRYETT